MKAETRDERRDWEERAAGPDRDNQAKHEGEGATTGGKPGERAGTPATDRSVQGRMASNPGLDQLAKSAKKKPPALQHPGSLRVTKTATGHRAGASGEDQDGKQPDPPGLKHPGGLRTGTRDWSIQGGGDPGWEHLGQHKEEEKAAAARKYPGEDRSSEESGQARGRPGQRRARARTGPASVGKEMKAKTRQVRRRRRSSPERQSRKETARK